MSNNTGVFGLSGYNDKNLEGLIPDKTRESYREYGYFGAGLDYPITTLLSSVQRIDYSNDTSTASIRGPLVSSRYRPGSTSNSSFGYYICGGSGKGINIIDRIDFSNDSSTASVRANSNIERRDPITVGNSNFGYVLGGLPSPGGQLSSTERISYSNDLTSPLFRGSLSLAKGGGLSCSNSNFGYAVAGLRTVPVAALVSTVDRISFANDTNTALNRVSFNTYGSGGSGNNNFGYLTTAAYSNTAVFRLSYSNDTSQILLRGTFSSSPEEQKPITGNSNFGYIHLSGLSSIERIDYSNDTVACVSKGKLAVNSTRRAATSSHSFGGSPISQYGVFAKPFGYFGGGAGPVSTIDRIDYSNDTSNTNQRNTLLSPRTSFAFFGNSSFAYAVGGIPLSTTIERLEYSNDSSRLITRGPLSSSRYQNRGTGNSNFGYSMGGRFPTSGPYLSSIDRINYTNDTSITLTRGPLSSAKSYGAATGNTNFGYYGGGFPGARSTIDRIDYANDTATASVRGTLSLARYNSSSTGNSNFGYFGGGAPGPRSTVDRIDYSNDTQTASVRGPLSSAKGYVAATGTQNFGYFGGGGFGPFPQTKVSTVDRIDYSNDTQTASVRGPLSSAKYVVSATSPTAFGGATDFTPTSTFFDIQSMRRIEDTTNESVKKRVLGSYGYFIGQYSVGLSRIDRIDYSNDTATASVRGPLSVARGTSGATGNSNYGYVGGGASFPPFILYSTIDRIDYSNDLSVALVRGPLGAAKYRIRTGTGTSNFGYFGGGNPAVSGVDRINYSNDTATALIRGTLSLARLNSSSTGNSNFGYFGGGATAAPSSSLINQVSTVDRINYSNDTSKASVRGPLSLVRQGLAATGNSNFGYYGGGAVGPTTVSTVDRIDYSNDTIVASTRGPLSSARNTLAATGNSNFGYFGGGYTGIVSVDRIDYSNDTETASVRGPLSSARSQLSATTNARSS
jgi:hypothetical protein